MKEQFMCLKNWEIESGIYFEVGKVYEGIRFNDGSSVRMYGEVGMVINFGKDSDYFKI